MATDLTDQEKTLIREKIREKYGQAAVSPAGCFSYPNRVQGLRQLGYPEECGLVGFEGRVVGVDITPGMVIRAWELAALLPFRNLSFQVATAESLPFPPQFFDAVTSNGIFNLVIDKERAAQEIFRVLKPGGRLLLADMLLVAPLPPERADLIENWYQ